MTIFLGEDLAGTLESGEEGRIAVKRIVPVNGVGPCCNGGVPRIQRAARLLQVCVLTEGKSQPGLPIHNLFMRL